MKRSTKRAMPVGFRQRLEQLIDGHASGSMRKFALDAGISPQTLFSVMGGTIPGADIICKICKTYNVSADYLLFGERAAKRKDG